MTVKTETKFDIAEFKRAYEEWDVPALLALYADDVEMTMISGDNPPSSPRVGHGKEVFEGMFTHCKSAGVKATVEHGVADANHAAATITCEFPDGRKVVGNSIMELSDGEIVHEHTTSA
jgi:ketosteroid isomerase-like protein